MITGNYPIDPLSTDFGSYIQCHWFLSALTTNRKSSFMHLDTVNRAEPQPSNPLE